jgi:hypothetical protein
MCYLEQGRESYTVANLTYVIPRGWCRFGLFFNPSKSDVHNVWNTWANCYHGTTPLAAESILQHGDLLLPGDRLLDGSILGIRPGHIPQKKYFLLHLLSHVLVWRRMARQPDGMIVIR